MLGLLKSINHVLGDTGKKLSDKFKEETEDPIYTPNFDLLNGVRGGEMRLSVTYYNELSASKKYSIKGTNPGEAAINEVIKGETLRHIACTESAYRQFKAIREGGVGIPLIGVSKDKNNQYKEDGGIGLMQLYYKKEQEIPDKNIVWNWRQNIIIGKALFHDKQKTAKQLYIKERKRLNDERAKLGLPACPAGTPPQLNAEQLQRETIRRYNCGAEYRWEPRDQPNCEGKWVIEPSCARSHKAGYDPIYVDKVLSCNIK